MAECPKTNDKALDELEKDITCAVCCGHYQDAKLPCNHYYCRACIESLARRSRGRSFPCPECRKDTTLPSSGVEQLLNAFFVERMKDVYDKMAKAEGKVEAVFREHFQKRESRCLLPPVHSVSLCALCGAAPCASCVRRAYGGKS